LVFTQADLEKQHCVSSASFPLSRERAGAIGGRLSRFAELGRMSWFPLVNTAPVIRSAHTSGV
jgi:hypothetical protein